MSFLKKLFALRQAYRSYLEMFNVFNQAQFHGGNSVNGNIGDQVIGPNGRVNPSSPGSFGTVTKAADPHIGQIAAKFRF